MYVIKHKLWIVIYHIHVKKLLRTFIKPISHRAVLFLKQGIKFTLPDLMIAHKHVFVFNNYDRS